MVGAVLARVRRARRGFVLVPFVVGAAGAVALAIGCGRDSTEPDTLAEIDGAPVTIGNGTARTFAVPKQNGEAASIGIELTATALDALPTTMTEWMLALPAGAAVAPWDHVAIDWNPQGHPPLDIYGVPHFDFHFYQVAPSEQTTIAGGPDTTMVPPADVPPDYASQVVSVPMMGVHWVDTSAAEFHGHPFDKTFIYGFYRGKMMFVEPMITRALLASHPDVTAFIKQPRAFQRAGLYPGAYGVHYDPENQTIRITLDSLVNQPGG